MEKVPSAVKFIHLGSFIYDERFGYNAYLIFSAPYYILVDLTPIQLADQFISSLEQHIDISKITHLVLQYTSISHYNTLNQIIERGFKGDIITSQFIQRQLKSSSIHLNIYSVDEIGYHLIYKNKTILHFHKLGFLPFPDMFYTYFPEKNYLLSSTLFSSFYSKENLLDYDFIKKSIFSMHQYLMPSSEFIKAPLEEIKKSRIEGVFPVLGYTFKDIIAIEMMDFVSRLDFYNTKRVIYYNDQNNEEINYIEIINHMLNKLQSQYPRIEILDLFIGSSISLLPDPLEIKKSTLTGYKLWNGFFETINAKKGLNWLMTLEPLVNKYHVDYGVEKPTPYRSMIVEVTAQKEELEKQKVDLSLEIESLNQTISQAKDLLLRCPITQLYNQEMFKQIIFQDIELIKMKPSAFHFILVQLDQLFQINQKYGKSIGDESLRHFAYLIEQVKIEKTKIFKQNGPGILVYMPDATFESIQGCANKLKNYVSDSNLFIERMTSSASIVSFDEVVEIDDDQRKIDAIIALLEKRMSHAKKLGSGEIIDRFIDIPKPSEGVILLVDEDPISQNMIYRIFSRINYDVKIAKDVNEALLFVNQYYIDVIISEINLSKIDGFQLKRQLNESNAHAKIPFVMVSHNKTLDNIKRGNILDVDLILEKPIIPEELIGHVKRFKERK
jgi:diguanylate cyclase (GGDEF)-like protein